MKFSNDSLKFVNPNISRIFSNLKLDFVICYRKSNAFAILRLIYTKMEFQDIVCPNESEICVPELTECVEGPCRAVPDCIANRCPQGLLVMDEDTFKPVPCSSDRQCTSLDIPSFCHIFRSSNGYCCWRFGNFQP